MDVLTSDIIYVMLIVTLKMMTVVSSARPFEITLLEISPETNLFR